MDQESASQAKEADPASPYGLIRREGGIRRVLQELNRWRPVRGAGVALAAGGGWGTHGVAGDAGGLMGSL
ncbi:MAG: hypothetical protein ACLP2P_03280 [Desulfobaccales bacterium]